jgi:tetratricopeptide (TPR) repeat protein
MHWQAVSIFEILNRMAGKTSGCREATAAGDKIRWAHGAVLGTVCVLIIGFFAWSAKSGVKELKGAQPADSYYNLLVQGFRAGQLNVKREAPPGLAQLPDPYDMEAGRPYRFIEGSPIFDMSYYKGKLYLYFGITPALVLFWPYAALTGHYLLHKQAAVIFCSVGFLAGVWLLWVLWRRYFAEVGVGVVVAGALALGLGTGTPLFLASCDFYEVAISCGYALTMLALVAIWKALHEPVRRGWWLAAASLAYGLAVGARPSLLFGAVILLVPVVQAWREGRRVWPVLMAAVGPIVIIGLGLMLYNFLRFDNPLEFGWHYILPSDRDVRPFSRSYLWFNFRLYFLELARWSSQFPFISDVAVPPLPAGHGMVEAYCGVLSNFPVLWLALAAPLAWRGRTAETRSILRRFLVAVVLLFGVCVLTLCLFFAVSFRYEIDFLPTLGLLAVIGIFGLERAQAGRPIWRNAVRWGWGLLLALSVAFNLFASYERLADFHENLGGVLCDNGQMDEGIAQFQKALEIRPNDGEANSSLGAALLQKGKVDEAIAHLQKALEIRPDNTLAHRNLGFALLQKGKVDEAIAHLHRALELQPNYVEADYDLGSVLFQIGRVDEAIPHFKRAVELRPDSADHHYNLGVALLQKGQVDEAITHLRKALENRPNFPEAHNNLGFALRQKGQVDEAIAHFQKALENKPNFPEAHNNLGFALLRKGKVDEAIAHFKRAVELRPDSNGTYYNLGCALLEKGQMHEAIACFQKALELEPNNPNNHILLAWLLATCPDDSIRNGPKAIELAQQAGRLAGGENPVILRTLAAAYAENGQFPEAVASAQRALQLATAQNNIPVVNALEEQLRFYQAGSPFRDTHLTKAPAPSTQNTFREVGK